MNDTMKNLLAAFHNDEGGAGATEYIILLILVACVIIGVVKIFGATIAEKFEDGKEKVRRDVTY